jgi:hypothetical protein
LIANTSQPFNAFDREISGSIFAVPIPVPLHPWNVLENEDVGFEALDLVYCHKQLVVARVIHLILVIGTGMTLTIRQRQTKDRPLDSPRRTS